MGFCCAFDFTLSITEALHHHGLECEEKKINMVYSSNPLKYLRLCQLSTNEPGYYRLRSYNTRGLLSRSADEA